MKQRAFEGEMPGLQKIVPEKSPTEGAEEIKRKGVIIQEIGEKEESPEVGGDEEYKSEITERRGNDIIIDRKRH